jgi:2Fe-2S ferredoxin
MAKIIFNFEDKSLPSKVVEVTAVDKSILELTEDYDIHLNHNCGGVCACSTCHIYIQQGDQFLEEISEKKKILLIGPLIQNWNPDWHVSASS